MERIAVFPNLDKEDSPKILKRLINVANENNVEVVLPMDAAKKFNEISLGRDHIETIPIDVALTIGGDGTLLGMCREYGAMGIPVCGINIGTLGFLTEIEPDELERKMEMIFNNKYFIEEHLLLAGFMKNDDGEEKFLFNAVNDVVVSKSGVARMLHMNLKINKSSLIECKSDGIIIASPTGSTAYSLSAGGPVVHPKVKALLITPICAHTFHLRPLVVDENDEIHIKVISTHKEITVTFDGQKSFNISPKYEVVVRKSPLPAKIIKFADKDYYRTLGVKFCGLKS